MVYSPQVLDHFENPRNVGELTTADITVQVENPACGDIMQLSLKLERSGASATIEDVRFRTRGCVTAIACGSLLTEMLRGKTASEARQIHRQQIVDALGGLSNETMHGSHLAMDALARALAAIR